MNLDDVVLLDDLQRHWELNDPPPVDLVDLMIAAVAAADLDWPAEWDLELLTLTYDSAREEAVAVRGLTTARTLTFGREQGPRVDLEVDGASVNGQVVGLPNSTGDATVVDVLLETTSGARWSTTVDEVGFFTISAPSIVGRKVTIRLTITVDGQRIATEWVTL